MNRNWIIFWTIYITALLTGAYAVLSSVSLDLLFTNKFVFINTFQRLTGLTLFVLITTQILLGAFMTRLSEVMGGKIFRFHINQGITSYIFMLIHPTLATFVGIGLFPTFQRAEFLYDLGRFALILFTISVFAGLFRTRPFLARHWKKFHILNYFTFYLVAYHSYFVGTDIQNTPFVFVYWLSVITISITVVLKIGYLLREYFLPQPR